MIVHEAAPARVKVAVVGQVPAEVVDRENGAVKASPIPVTVADGAVILVRVRVCVALVVFGAVFGNGTVAGATLRSGAMPVPVSATGELATVPPVAVIVTDPV